jgi:hypothetical protein
MESLYGVMALALQSNCPDGFDKAFINARLSDGFSQQRYVCEKDGAQIYPDLSPNETSQIDDVLHELREAMTIPGQEPWSRCTFTLFPDGKFKFDVEYDD